MKKLIILSLFFIGCNTSVRIDHGKIIEKKMNNTKTAGIVFIPANPDSYEFHIAGWNQMTGGYADTWIDVDAVIFSKYKVGDTYP